jgi:DNA-binding transcriptional LysR family regulator
MDTRQLEAFCAVVERKSFSQAAERLGVTQPAVSLQIRSLEERLGRKLIDRSGRRVEPTEAGLALYRGAQRVLAAEEQLLADLADETGELQGRLAIGASTGPGAHLVPLLLAELAREHPSLSVALSVGDTDAIIERVAERELELGVVGARGRHRSVDFEPLMRDEIVLAVPPGHRFAGREVSLEELQEETIVSMQEGAAMRHVIADVLRRAGLSAKLLDSRLELGLQESVKNVVAAGEGVAFIALAGMEAELAAGTLARARVEGVELARELYVVRPRGRTPTRAAEAFLALARERAA